MQRNTQKKIRIIEINDMLLRIRPADMEQEPYTRPLYQHELFNKLIAMTHQLKDYGLNEDVDYIKSDLLEFHGKSHVVRALHAIPIDLFVFDAHSRFSKERIQKYKNQYTLCLAPNNTFYTEIPLVKQTQTLVFNALCHEIRQIHSKFPEAKSLVISRLEEELRSLSMREDTLFENTNFMILMSALYNATTAENENATVILNSFSIFKTKKESLLLPLYNELLSKYKSFMPTNFKTGKEMKICNSNKPK